MQEIGKVIINQQEEKLSLLVCALSNGHAEIEGVPGLGKTKLLKTFATVVGGEFSRIQFTPDLMPFDITGGDELDGETAARLKYRPGPIFANFVLADEINRATPKTQSALLEAMEERQVTYKGVTRPLPPPFMVVATQNPLEFEGTYPLPEAQLDRFMMRILVDYPAPNDELEMMEIHGRKTQAPEASSYGSLDDLSQAQKAVELVRVDPLIRQYMRDIVLATRKPGDFGLGSLIGYIKLGASPRASLAFESSTRALAALQGRDYVLPADAQALAKGILNHRLALTYEATVDKVNAADVVAAIVEHLPVPDIAIDQLEKASRERTRNN